MYRLSIIDYMAISILRLNNNSYIFGTKMKISNVNSITP